MIVNNPTDKDITVKLKGVIYSVKAKDSLSNVPKEQALYWKGLHNFLILSDETKKVAETATVEEPVEEILSDEVVEETQEGEAVPSAEEPEEEIKKVIKK